MKIFATADLHIGMTFARYDDKRRSALQEARLQVLEWMIGKANEASANLFIVAGDLFDRQNCSKKLIFRVLEGLNRFEGTLTVLLPGNHDYLQEGSEGLWDVISREGGDRTLVLREQKPYDLGEFGLDAVLYPAPCRDKHSPESAAGWVAMSEKDPARQFHLGVAHGSVEGISPDFDGRYYPMKKQDLRNSGVGLWIVGHTHQSSSDGFLFIPGTPEPDGFDCPHEGSALLIDLIPSAEPRAVGLSTGTYRFIDALADLEPDRDPVKSIAALLPSDRSSVLLRLSLRGCLSEDRWEDLTDYLKNLKEEFFYLLYEDEGLTREISQKQIDAAYPAGSFPHRLLSDLAAEKDPVLLNLAWTLIQEASG